MLQEKPKGIVSEHDWGMCRKLRSLVMCSRIHRCSLVTMHQPSPQVKKVALHKAFSRRKFTCAVATSVFAGHRKLVCFLSLPWAPQAVPGQC